MSNELISDQGKLIRAELDIQITTAKAYPRDVNSFISNATQLATQDEETAESCFYCLPSRSGEPGNSKQIEGASIRLAEIAAVCWGNIHAAYRIIENDGKFITAEGVAWDLERNVKIVCQVKRSIEYKNGSKYNQNLQMVTGNAAGAIAFRNAVFKVVPKALIDRVSENAKKYAIGDKKDLTNRVKSIFDKFSQWNINHAQILDFFKRSSIDDFTREDLEKLIGIGTSIKEGYIKPEEAFTSKEEKSTENKISIIDELKNEQIRQQKTGLYRLTPNDPEFNPEIS